MIQAGLNQPQFGAVKYFNNEEKAEREAGKFHARGRRALVATPDGNLYSSMEISYVFTGKDAQKFEDLKAGLEFTRKKLQSISWTFRTYENLGELKDKLYGFVENMHDELQGELDAMLDTAKPAYQAKNKVQFGKIYRYESTPRQSAYDKAQRYAEYRERSGAMTSLHYDRSSDDQVTVFVGKDAVRYNQLNAELRFLNKDNWGRYNYGVSQTFERSMYNVPSLEAKYKGFVESLLVKAEKDMKKLLKEATPGPRAR